MTEIKFEDIRKGDRIRAQFAPDYGITITGEGVAHKLRYGDTWVTSEGGFLVRENDAATITLLHRPSPAEPEGLGAVIEYAGNEYVSINRTPGKPRWVFVADNRTYNEAVVYSWSEFDPDSIEVEP